MMEELILQLQRYGLSIIKKEEAYCLVNQETNECYEKMSISDIQTLVSKWNIENKDVAIY